MKKVTVMGIIGNTQGVTIAARPARKLMRKKKSSESFAPVPGSLELNWPMAVSYTHLTLPTN